MTRLLTLALACLLLLATPAFAAAYRTTNASWYDTRPRTCGGKPVPGWIIRSGYWTAHKTLPCFSRIRVTRGETTLLIRVADRGPYVRGRDLDLTRKTFERFERASRGVIRVQYRPE